MLGWKELIDYDHTGKNPPKPYPLKSGAKNVTTNAYASAAVAGKILLVHDIVPGGATLIDSDRHKLFEYRGAQELAATDVISTGADAQKNFWMGYYLTTGGALTKIEPGQDLKIWSKDNGLPSVHSLTRFKNKLYVGTSDGLFEMDYLHRLNRVPGTTGTYYNMATIFLDGKEKLLVSDHGGLKEWVGNKFISIYDDPAEGFTILQGKKDPYRLVLNGETHALTLIYHNGKWNEGPSIPTGGKMKLQETPDGNFWTRNLRIDFTKSPVTISGITSPSLKKNIYGNLSVSPQGDILLGTGDGLFIFDKQKNQFVLWDALGPVLSDGKHDLSHPYRVADSMYLLVSSANPSNSYLCTITKSGPVIVDAPFKRLPNNGTVECLWSDADGTVWIGGSFGLISYNPALDIKDYNQAFDCLIRKIKIGADSTIFDGKLFRHELEKNHPEFSYGLNQIHFEFAAPFFDKEEETLYSYRLLGQGENWAPWEKVYYKEFNNLSEGEYTFQVKAKNVYSKESRIASFSFRILAPWYRSWWSYLLYTLSGIVFMIGILRWRTAKLQQRRILLEKIVSRQTAELREKNNTLNSANEELRSTNEELHSTNEKLVSTQKQLVASEKMASLGQLTAGIAHEINNPINFISGGVQALHILHQELFEQGAKMSPEELNERRQEIAQLMSSMTNGVMRTANIIKSLREFSSPVDSISDEARINIHEPIENALVLLARKISDAQIKVDKEFAATSTIKANPSQLSQVFVNLIDNAIFALSSKTGDRNLTLRTFETESDLTITISDNGGGIPEAVQPRIFEPFHTTKDVGQGTGLGLFICYSIIQKHGGSISFVSNSSGTTFEIRIPKSLSNK